MNTKAEANIIARVHEVMNARVKRGQYVFDEDNDLVGVPTNSPVMATALNSLVDAGTLLIKRSEDGMSYVALPASAKGNSKKSDSKAAKAPKEPRAPKEPLGPTAGYEEFFDRQLGKRLCLSGSGKFVTSSKANFAPGGDATLGSMFLKIIKGKADRDMVKRAMRVADHPAVRGSLKLGPLAKEAAAAARKSA